jgi:hypothetical protein
VHTEHRFDALSDKVSSIKAVAQKSEELRSKLSLNIATLTDSDEFPKLPTDTHFKYDDQLPSFYRALLIGEHVTISVVRRSSRVVAFGIAEVPKNDSVSIELINVAFDSRRKAGVSELLQLEGQEFNIGIGHVLVLHLINELDSKRICTDATTSPSRYIFKSLGFRPYSEDNPCLLHFQKS